MKAIPVLIRLENEADFPQNKVLLSRTWMKCYYEKKDYVIQLFMQIKF
jgi:hypothetical protein